MTIVGRRALTLLAVLTALLAASGVAQVLRATPAAADFEYCWRQPVHTSGSGVSYVKRCRTIQDGQSGHGGTSAGGGPSPAECGLDKHTMSGPYSWFCIGRAACAIEDDAQPYQPMPAPPAAGGTWRLLVCWPCATCAGPPGQRWILNGPAARPPIVQALEAFGRLDVEHGTPSHSPKAKAVVGLATWFWLDPGLFTETRGTSAEGLVAIATPTSTVWDPGDGSGTVTCDGPGRAYAGSEDAAGACTHTYRSSSPDYHGQVTRHWTVRYEDGGAVVNIPGAPLALDLADGFDLAVVETQVVDDRGGN
jgi:hypothetical protein